MPGVDWIPGVSQVKSFCQLVTGDAEGAARTLENFTKECPVVSQVTSVVQAISGDTDGAIETQQRCLGTINNVANGIPVVGHIKGGVHHVLGDHEGGNQALQAATRSTVVLGSGVAVGLASGGLAAIPAGIAAGSAYDLADSAISDKPKGVFAVVQNAVDNPNAGNIFDATAMVVGDGLAGYSGGQIGQQISTQVKLNSLEAARAAKTDQLNAALFPEKGGANAMTSGQLTSLGQQINALTGEISAIRHGTPQYWFDPKSNQVVVQQTTGSVNVVIVNVSTEDVESSRQENGLQADCYAGEIEVVLSPEKREEKKSNYVQQKAKIKTLGQERPDTTTITDKDWEEFKDNLERDNDPRKNLTKKMLELLARSMWLHVQMPQEFGYTGAILANNTFQGLVHTFVRHWDQWLEYTPSLSHLMEKLPEHIRQLLQKVRYANDEKDSGNAINELNEAIKNLKNETYVVVQLALFEIQMKLHEFLKRNVTSVQYLEEEMNNRGPIQIDFKVTNSSGNTGIMVVCVSEQLYPSIGDFGDPRPVRTIITVFFKTWNEYKKLKNRTGKAWSKK